MHVEQAWADVETEEAEKRGFSKDIEYCYKIEHQSLHLKIPIEYSLFLFFYLQMLGPFIYLPLKKRYRQRHAALKKNIFFCL